jgi:hypothetical protein
MAKAKTTKKAAPAKKAGPPVKEKKVTIGSVAEEAILQGKTNEEVLETVMKQFPEAKTTPASVNWYRQKLRRDLGKNKVPTARTVKKETGTSAPEKKRAKKADAPPKKTAATKKASGKRPAKKTGQTVDLTGADPFA